MCTVSIVGNGDGFRLVCNRDERLSRPRAQPPAARRIGRRWAVSPIDPPSRGAWIGVNDAGLTAAILNRTISSGIQRTAPISRGVIVPTLLACSALDEALAEVEAFDHRQFEPFRVVLVQWPFVAVVTSDDPERAPAPTALSEPRMFTSSSLGDHVVHAPRQALFDDLVVASDDRLDGQFRFHRHRWMQRLEISVLMRREHAGTVSRTTIDVTGRGADVRYERVC